MRGAPDVAVSLLMRSVALARRAGEVAGDLKTVRGASLIGSQLVPPAEARRMAPEPRTRSVDFSVVGVLGRALARVASAGTGGGVASGSEMTTILIGVLIRVSPAAASAVGGAVAAGGVSVRWAMVTGVVLAAVAYIIYFRMGRWKHKRV